MENLHKKNDYVMREFCKVFEIEYSNILKESTFMGKKWWGDSISGKYLDGINNISHVGHCHPKVSNTLYEQRKTLNTNTRYLYDIINEYSDKLLSKFPKKLNGANLKFPS